MARFRLKACAKCGGDLALDEGDWICLQCGTYYYVRLYPGVDLRRQPKLERQSDVEKSLPDGQIYPPPLYQKEATEDFPSTKGDSGEFQHTVITASLAAVIWASGVVKG